MSSRNSPRDLLVVLPFADSTGERRVASLGAGLEERKGLYWLGAIEGLRDQSNSFFALLLMEPVVLSDPFRMD